MTIKKLTVAAAIAVGIATCSFNNAMAACPCDQRPVVTESTCCPAADIPVVIQDGDLDIKYAKTGGIEATNLTAKMAMKDNIFYVNKLKTDAFEGQLKGNVSMNLVSSLIRASVSGTGFDAEKALLGLANMKDTITGTAAFDANVSLKGATYEEQMKTLLGEVNFTLTDGQLGPFARLENLILAENIRQSEFFLFQRHKSGG